jgi:phosphoribosylglycinamide formyltransferase-1
MNLAVPEGDRLKVGVLISGRGTNMQALIAACAAPGFPAAIGLVVSNEARAAGLARAAEAGIATAVLDHRPFAGDRPAFERALTHRLEAAGIRFVCLAGFMRLLTETFVEHWRDRMINIHPSLLPAFRGLDTHRRALEAGVRLHGCTVHFVRTAMDDGPILVQAAVPVVTGDTETSLAARVLAAEHRCYPLALRLVAENRVQVENERCVVAADFAPDAALINPPPAAG